MKSSTAERPYWFKSEKYGRMLLMAEPCRPSCKAGRWEEDTGLVECSTCSRVFDPDFPEPEPCVECKESLAFGGWMPAATTDESYYCDECAGFKVSA